MMENVLLKLRPCSTKPIQRPFCTSAENCNVFTKNPPWLRLLCSKVAGLEFIPAI